MPHEKFINPWGPGGKYWPPKWMEENVLTKDSEIKKPSEERALSGGRVASNFSEKPVYYKPEESNTALELKAEDINETFVDGVATQLHKDQVYKVPDLTSIIINKDGSVEPASEFSATIIAIQTFRGKANWINTPPDSNWDALFEAAKNKID